MTRESWKSYKAARRAEASKQMDDEYPDCVPVIEYIAPDGTAMKMTITETKLPPAPGAPNGEVIPAGFTSDGNSSPFLPKIGRFAGIRHDYRFRYCKGWAAANCAYYVDMRRFDKRGVLISALYTFVLFAVPWAYIRHKLRRRFGVFRADEERWKNPLAASCRAGKWTTGISDKCRHAYHLHQILDEIYRQNPKPKQ